MDETIVPFHAEVNYFDENLDEMQSLFIIVLAHTYGEAEEKIKKEIGEELQEIVALTKIDAIPIC